MKTRTVLGFFLALTGALGLFVPESHAALRKTKSGYYITGTGIRVKEVLLVDVEVYAATHYMKVVPNPPTKSAVIEANVDKAMVLKMLRDVDLDRIVDGIKEGYQRNGWEDMAQVEHLFGILVDDLEEGESFQVMYDADKETTTAISGDRTRKASVRGRDFMRATWSTWFAKIDSPGLGDQLLQYVVPLPDSQKGR